MASELMRDLGYNTCSIDLGKGFAWIKFVQHFPLAQLMSKGLDKEQVSLERVREFGRWMAAEYLINNLDVHEENFLIEMDSKPGQDFLIVDHDNIFLPITLSIEDFINRSPEVAILVFGRPLKGESREPIHKAFWNGFVEGAKELQSKGYIIDRFFNKVSANSKKGIVVRRIIRDTDEYKTGKPVPYYSVLVSIDEMRTSMEARMANLQAAAEGRLYPVFLDGYYFRLGSCKPDYLDGQLSPAVNSDIAARQAL